MHEHHGGGLWRERRRESLRAERESMGVDVGEHRPAARAQCGLGGSEERIGGNDDVACQSRR